MSQQFITGTANGVPRQSASIVVPPTIVGKCIAIAGSLALPVALLLVALALLPSFWTAPLEGDSQGDGFRAAAMVAGLLIAACIAGAWISRRGRVAQVVSGHSKTATAMIVVPLIISLALGYTANRGMLRLAALRSAFNERIKGVADEGKQFKKMHEQQEKVATARIADLKTQISAAQAAADGGDSEARKKVAELQKTLDKAQAQHAADQAAYEQAMAENERKLQAIRDRVEAQRAEGQKKDDPDAVIGDVASAEEAKKDPQTLDKKMAVPGILGKVSSEPAAGSDDAGLAFFAQGVMLMLALAFPELAPFLGMFSSFFGGDGGGDPRDVQVAGDLVKDVCSGGQFHVDKLEPFMAGKVDQTGLANAQKFLKATQSALAEGHRLGHISDADFAKANGLVTERLDVVDTDELNQFAHIGGLQLLLTMRELKTASAATVNREQRIDQAISHILAEGRKTVDEAVVADAIRAYAKAKIKDTAASSLIDSTLKKQMNATD